MGYTYLVFHKETTPLSKLPPLIYYSTRYRLDGLIDGIKAVRVSLLGKVSQKQYSINKYTLEGAYKKAIEYTYGKNKVKKILKEFPVPNIHPSDLYVKNKASPVYGVNLSLRIPIYKTNPTLSGFIAVGKASIQKYFSIRKLGLEEAWQRAIEYRYTDMEPMPNDSTELPKEYWDLINPRYRIKGE